MSFEIKNKNVLITGATSGIGEATAIDLAKKGANIFFIARNNLKAQICLIKFFLSLEKELNFL